LLLAAGVVAGCAVLQEEQQVQTPRVRGTKAAGPVAHRVKLLVFDGDLRRGVSHATVWIGRRRLLTDQRGVVTVRVVPRPAIVKVRRAGYSSAERRFDFRRASAFTFRIYQPRLQWTMYGADPARTGFHRSVRLRPPFRIVWSIPHGDQIEFPAVVSDGFAYIANRRGTVQAFSMRHGTLAWRRHTHTIMASSLAVWHDKLVVHGMGDGRVRILNRKNGRILWTKSIGSAIESSPVVRYDIDYFGTRDGRIVALNLRTRRIRWAYHSGAKVTGSVSLAGRTAYVGNYGGQVLALDTVTGRRRWSSSVNGRVYGTSPVSGGRLFVPSSTGGSVTSFSTRGARLWSFYTGSYVYSTPATWAGRVVFGSYNGVLYCVSARTGGLLWTVRVGGAISGAPVIVDGIAYAASFGDRTVGVDVRTGRVIFRFPHGHYVPVSGNGSRLLLHGYSKIWAVEPRRR
jgi:eukaryotic-like serine/threonine-protein kinase